MPAKKIFFALLFIFLSAFLFSRKVMDTSAVEKVALSHIENKRYLMAVKLIQKGFAGFTFKEKMLFLKGRSYEGLKMWQMAVRTYDRVIKTYPDSPWAGKSYFRKVQALIEQKKFSEAYPILKSRLERLLDSSRRGKLARIYLKLAKERSFQSDPKKNDYNKALIFYQRAWEIGSLAEEKSKTHYAIGLCQYHLKKYRESRKQLKEYMRVFPGSGEIKECQFYLGDIESKLGDSYRSRSHFLNVLKEKGKPDSSEKLSAKALYHIGLSYGLPGTRSEEELDLGVKYWRELIKKYPEDKLAAEAAYRIGLSYNKLIKLRDKAIEELLSFVDKYPKNEKAPLALEQVARIYLSKNEHDKALGYLQRFLKSYPNHMLWQNVQRQIINTKLSKGFYLVGQKRYPEGEEILKAFLEEYPIDSRNAGIMYTLGEISYLQKDYDEALKRWNKLSKKYPNNVVSHKALYSMGKVYVSEKQAFEKGMDMFKQVKYNPWHNKSQVELSSLKKKSLALETRRQFFSREKPSVHVKARNIKSFVVNIYRLNLEEYFVRNNRLDGI
ncbi:MAG: tetratricopeptide repeat protein, partial [Spirochaetota bacterium]|nr:tetratricopeptide repeat protein [Spirochaetota bacterium]